MKTIKERQSWATAFCQKAGMRLTPLRKAILSFLAQYRLPASLEMVSQASGVKGKCDSTTLYRTFVMFKDAGLVRLVPTPQKASYFVLNAPDDMAHFLICRQCGCVTAVAVAGCHVSQNQTALLHAGILPGAAGIRNSRPLRQLPK